MEKLWAAGLESFCPGKTCKDGYEKDGNGGCGYAFASKSELQTAVDAWTSDKTAAKAKYGSISTWGVSAVTDMSYLFLDDEDREYRSSFNDDISTWDARRQRWLLDRPFDATLDLDAAAAAGLERHDHAEHVPLH